MFAWLSRSSVATIFFFFFWGGATKKSFKNEYCFSALAELTCTFVSDLVIDVWVVMEEFALLRLFDSDSSSTRRIYSAIIELTLSVPVPTKHLKMYSTVLACSVPVDLTHIS